MHILASGKLPGTVQEANPSEYYVLTRCSATYLVVVCHFLERPAFAMTSPSRSGVFSKAADSRVERFTESISFDHRLYAQDIAGSIAHAEMLAKVGLLSAQECADICRTLEAIRGEIEAGKFAFKTDLEDIHMHIEQALI